MTQVMFDNKIKRLKKEIKDMRTLIWRQFDLYYQYWDKIQDKERELRSMAFVTIKEQ